MAHILLAIDAGVHQAVCAGEGDVAAAGAAQQGGDAGSHRGDGTEVGEVRGHFAQGGLGDDGHHQNGEQDDGSQNGGDLIHDGLCVLVHEDDDTKAAGDDGADLLGDAQHGVEAQGDAAHVTDVEGQAADGDQDGNKHAKAGEQGVGNVLCALLGNADNGPDVHLGGNVHQNDQQDDQDELGALLCGKGSGLGQEAGADGGSSHQESRAEQYGGAGLIRSVVTHYVILPIY